MLKYTTWDCIFIKSICIIHINISFIIIMLWPGDNVDYLNDNFAFMCYTYNLLCSRLTVFDFFE